MMLRLLVSVCVLTSSASAEPLGHLYDRMAADIRAGRPVVVIAHIPLCDNRVIPCGNGNLGNGDVAKWNLYWGTSGGFSGWFRTSKRWRLVLRQQTPKKNVLETLVWHANIQPARALKQRGVTKAFDVYVVGKAWRGTEIRKAMTAFSRDALTDERSTLMLPSGTEISTGGRSHLVAYVGHNGWMDYPNFKWPKPKGTQPKAVIVVACLTKSYLKTSLTNATVAPLLFTRSLLYAGSHSAEGAIWALVHGKGYKGIFSQAVANYAKGQSKSLTRVRAAFTNPSRKNW